MLTEQILVTVARHDLIPPGTRVLAAVSGGADSVALALTLARLAPGHGFSLAAIAHLNHGLRGVAADEDQAAVEALAARLGVPCITAREDVAARAAEAGESIETAARRVRYAFLERAASDAGADCIATGHTADDQAETVVMRLMRGAGLHGLSAIRPRNGRVIRPLLDVRRAHVEAFLREAGEPWRDDATNADAAMARNRVRHEALPALKAIGGEGVVDALARTASLIQDDADELDRLAIEMTPRAVLSDGALDMAVLAAAGPALARRVIRAALESVAGGRFLSLEHVEAVRSLIRQDAARRIQLPGIVASRVGGAIRIEPAPIARGSVAFEAPLPVPGRAGLPEWGLVLSVEVGSVTPHELSALRARADAVAVQGVEGAMLTVRNRRPGDALRPLGAPGRRKLQDLLVDRKIGRGERDRVPLVVDDQGRIVWVVGHTIADEFRVTSPEARVLLLKVRRAVGGSV